MGPHTEYLSWIDTELKVQMYKVCRNRSCNFGISLEGRITTFPLALIPGSPTSKNFGLFNCRLLIDFMNKSHFLIQHKKFLSPFIGFILHVHFRTLTYLSGAHLLVNGQAFSHQNWQIFMVHIIQYAGLIFFYSLSRPRFWTSV